MSDCPPSEVAEKIRTLPEDLQPWVGRLIWWDRYSHLYTRTPEFLGWVRTHSTDNPDPDRLTEALIEMGYTPELARLRACGGDGAETRIVDGLPLPDIRTTPFSRMIGAGGMPTRCGVRGYDGGFYKVSLPSSAGWQ
jgi:hypothetical protein